ncbi:MAG: CotH kinase family protein [Bacteroidota bacterium]
MHKILPTFLLAVLFFFPLFSQDLPKEMKISDDGRRLTLGGNQTTGFYDDTQVKVIELEFDQPNYWNLLDDDIPAKLTYEGVEYEGVGVRFKGATSDFMNNSQKKSFNISVDFSDEDLDIEGYQTTNLNGGFQDPSNMREILFNWIGRHYNPSLKSNFVHLKINGDTWGAYTNVQQLNNDYIREWFLNADGSRFRCIDPTFEAGGGGGGGGGGPQNGPCSGGGGGPGNPDGWGGGPSSLNWLGTDTVEYQENYDLKGSDRLDPWGDLITCIGKLNNLPINQMADSLKYYFDIDKTLWYLAHEIMLTDEDGYIYKGRMDYYVYFDDVTQTLVPMEYDGNSTMESNLVDWSPFQREDDECFPLVHRIMQVPEFRQRYLAHCRTIINDYMDIDLIHDKIDFYASLIDDLEANDPVGDQLFSYNQYLNGVQELKDFFEDRRNFLLANEEVAREGLAISNVVYAVDGLAFEQPAEDDEVVVTATIANGDPATVNLYFGTGLTGHFEKTEMFDDGQHEDGAANDGVFGATIPPIPKGEYVRYYVEAIKADGFGTRTYEPVGAEHDVFLYQVKPGEQVVSDVVINEIMASNDFIQADQDGEYDDWIELYNLSGNTIDLSGYYLSDDATNLTKWEFPTGSTISGGGYLIIWADEDGSQDGLHANFKLAKDGEALYFTTPTEEIANELVFGPQETDKGLAREPNGTGDFVIKNPTFNANNDNATSTTAKENTFEELRVFPNPVRHTLSIEFESLDSKNKQFQIYNTLGVQVFHGSSFGKTELNVSDWSKGFYLLKIENEVVKLLLQ